MGLIYPKPVTVSWHPDEGTWPATAHAVLDLADAVKINFAVHVPGSRSVSYRAGKKYEGVLEEGTPLYNDLHTWLKGDFSVITNEKGELDLRRLVGMRADILLVHIPTKGHETPFVHIAAIRPAETLVPQSGQDELRMAA